MVWLPVWLEESFACRDVLFFAGSMEDKFKDDVLVNEELREDELVNDELAAERADGEAEEEVLDLEEEDVDDLAEEEVEDEDERDDDE